MQLIDKVSTMNREEANHKKGNLKPVKTKKNDDEEPMFDDDEEEELLSPSSRIFHEPNYNIHILAIMGWKTPNGPNLHLIKETLSNTVLKHPHFSSVQVMDEKDGGKVRWVPSQVNLDNHIIVKEIDQNMQDLSQNKVIDEYVSNLSRTSMDKSKPLWELHILMLKSPNSSSKPFLQDGISIFRIHHSLGDGVSLVSLLLSCTRKTSDPNSTPTLMVQNVGKLSTSRRSIDHIGDGGLFFFRIWCYLLRLWLKVKVITHSMVDLMLFLATAWFLKDTKTPIKSSKTDNDNDPAYRRLILHTVSLDDIKLVKNETNATVNDVVVGVIQAGLSRYLNRRYGEEKDEEKNNNLNLIPRDIKCRATVLINLRPLSATNATDEVNEKKIGRVREGNCFGFVLIPLKIGMVDNPLDHVCNAKATMNRKKQSFEVVWTSYILGFILKLFGYKAATALAKRVPLQTTLTFSNVMGPTEEISFCDHPMTFMAATCYGQPTPLMIHAVSYTNKLTFAISVDERTIPDPYEFGQDFVESLEAMKKAVVDTKSH